MKSQTSKNTKYKCKDGIFMAVTRKVESNGFTIRVTIKELNDIVEYLRARTKECGKYSRVFLCNLTDNLSMVVTNDGAKNEQVKKRKRN